MGIPWVETFGSQAHGRKPALQRRGDGASRVFFRLRNRSLHRRSPAVHLVAALRRQGWQHLSLLPRGAATLSRLCGGKPTWRWRIRAGRHPFPLAGLGHPVRCWICLCLHFFSLKRRCKAGLLARMSAPRGGACADGGRPWGLADSGRQGADGIQRGRVGSTQTKQLPSLQDAAALSCHEVAGHLARPATAKLGVPPVPC